MSVHRRIILSSFEMLHEIAGTTSGRSTHATTPMERFKRMRITVEVESMLRTMISVRRQMSLHEIVSGSAPMGSVSFSESTLGVRIGRRSRSSKIRTAC